MQKQQDKNKPSKQNQNTTTADTKQAGQPFQNQTQTNSGEQVFTTTQSATHAGGQKGRSNEESDQQRSDVNRGHVPREINLPTGEKTNVAKEVYGGGQRPERNQSDERAGTQFSVDPSTSTPRSALDDDYAAGEEADRKPMRNTSANARPQVRGDRTDSRRGQNDASNPAP